jgi:hypothetical protein
MFKSIEVFHSRSAHCAVCNVHTVLNSGTYISTIEAKKQYWKMTEWINFTYSTSKILDWYSKVYIFLVKQFHHRKNVHFVTLNKMYDPIDLSPIEPSIWRYKRMFAFMWKLQTRQSFVLINAVYLPYQICYVPYVESFLLNGHLYLFIC